MCVYGLLCCTLTVNFSVRTFKYTLFISYTQQEQQHLRLSNLSSTRLKVCNQSDWWGHHVHCSRCRVLTCDIQQLKSTLNEGSPRDQHLHAATGDGGLAQNTSQQQEVPTLHYPGVINHFCFQVSWKICQNVYMTWQMFSSENWNRSTEKAKKYRFYNQIKSYQQWCWVGFIYLIMSLKQQQDVIQALHCFHTRTHISSVHSSSQQHQQLNSPSSSLQPAVPLCRQQLSLFHRSADWRQMFSLHHNNINLINNIWWYPWIITSGNSFRC